MEFPVQIGALAITVAAGKGLTVTVTELVLKQPVAVIVSVRVYIVVVEGETVGLEDVEVNPAGELVHEYVLPATAVAPIDNDVPLHIVVLEIVVADGKGFTVIVTEFDFTQP
jgi:hypothetical protein